MVSLKKLYIYIIGFELTFANKLLIKNICEQTYFNLENTLCLF